MTKEFGFVIGAIALVAIAGVSLTAVNVATTPARAVNQVVSTENVLNSYDAFYTLKQRYEARLGDIRNLEELNASETNEDQRRINQINLIAMRSACRTLATRYNADAQNLTSSWFRDGRLPQNLNVEVCG